jgi:hypothetical protein
MTKQYEDYLKILELRNGYCSCPQLAELFRTRKTADGLERLCEHFKTEADLQNPKPSDREFLADYKRRAEELKQASEGYHRLLTREAEKGKVRFVLHDVGRQSPVGKISFSEAMSLLNENDSEIIITMHCSNCNQQIDVAD